MQKVAITGMGIISSIGNDVKSNYQSLVNGNHGISQIEFVDTNNKFLVGEIKKSNADLEKIIGLPSQHNFSRTSMLGVIAIREALKDAAIDVGSNNHQIGLVNATTVGGMDMTEKYFYEFIDDPSNRRFIESHDAGNNSHNIADFIGLKGLVTTVSTACSSAANAIMFGAQLINSGKLDQVIVGGMDALSKFTINGFSTLMILSDTYNQPFDDNRKGLNLGEAGAYLILESEASYQKRNIQPKAFLQGFGNANDAFHQTASSENGEGAFLAMEKALQLSELKTSDIDYINVHGTATPNNDLSEGRAMIQLFGKNTPDFSSTKPFTGHTLAAAASVEAIYSILSMQHQTIFPNLNHQSKMKEFDLVPVKSSKNKNLNFVLSNSFGFGGNCSSLILSKN